MDFNNIQSKDVKIDGNYGLGLNSGIGLDGFNPNSLGLNQDGIGLDGYDRNALQYSGLAGFDKIGEIKGINQRFADEPSDNSWSPTQPVADTINSGIPDVIGTGIGGVDNQQYDNNAAPQQYDNNVAPQQNYNAAPQNDLDGQIAGYRDELNRLKNEANYGIDLKVNDSLRGLKAVDRDYQGISIQKQSRNLMDRIGVSYDLSKLVELKKAETARMNSEIAKITAQQKGLSKFMDGYKDVLDNGVLKKMTAVIDEGNFTKKAISEFYVERNKLEKELMKNNVDRKYWANLQYEQTGTDLSQYRNLIDNSVGDVRSIQRIAQIDKFLGTDTNNNFFTMGSGSDALKNNTAFGLNGFGTGNLIWRDTKVTNANAGMVLAELVLAAQQRSKREGTTYGQMTQGEWEMLGKSISTVAQSNDGYWYKKVDKDGNGLGSIIDGATVENAFRNIETFYITDSLRQKLGKAKTNQLLGPYASNDKKLFDRAREVYKQYSSETSELKVVPRQTQYREATPIIRRGSAVYKDTSGSKVSRNEIYSYLKTKGWDPRIAYAVMGAESGYRTDVTGDKNNRAAPTGSGGLMQINKSVHRKKIGNRNVYNWKDNIDIAYEVYKEAGNRWRPWGAYTNGSYKKFLT